MSLVAKDPPGGRAARRARAHLGRGLPAAAPAPQARPGRQCSAITGLANRTLGLHCRRMPADRPHRRALAHHRPLRQTSHPRRSDAQAVRPGKRIRIPPVAAHFVRWLNHRLLTEETVTAHSIQQIVDYVVAEDYDGFDLDLEAVEAADRDAYTAYVAALGRRCTRAGKR